MFRCLLVALCVFFLPTCFGSQSLHRDNQALYRDITHAKSAIYVEIYTLLATNPRLRFPHDEYTHQIQYALVKAKQRGVHVHMILNRFGPTSRSVDQLMQRRELSWCRYHHMDCQLSSTRFVFSHQKFIVIDEAMAYVLTGNLPWCWYSNRCAINYMARIKDPSMVNYLMKLWRADHRNGIQQQQRTPMPIPTNLIVSPVNASDKIINTINHATHSLWIEQPFLSDQDHLPQVLIDALQRAVKRHVIIHVITDMPGSTRHWKIHPALVRLSQSSRLFTIIKNPSPHFLHAKIIIQDNAVAIVGSVNWSDEAFYHNREVSLITNDTKIIHDVVVAMRDVMAQQS